jgi:hypothetical protein
MDTEVSESECARGADTAQNPDPRTRQTIHRPHNNARIQRLLAVFAFLPSDSRLILPIGCPRRSGGSTSRQKLPIEEPTCVPRILWPERAAV